MYAFLLKYKTYIAGAIVAMLLVFAAHVYVSRAESQAYDRGYDVANTAWMKKGSQYVSQIDDYKAKNVALNEQLKAETDRKKAEEEKKKTEVGNKQNTYIQTADAKKQCFSPEAIDLYNTSLGE